MPEKFIKGFALLLIAIRSEIVTLLASAFAVAQASKFAIFFSGTM